MTSAFDRWLTTQPDDRGVVDELDPIHEACGHPCSDHDTVQVTDADGNDYETQACPVEDAAALWLRYCAEANAAAEGSSEDGPGNMDDWPTFEVWKAEQREQAEYDFHPHLTAALDRLLDAPKAGQ